MNLQEAVAKWPQLRPLCLILKVFLQQRELNEVYSGGIECSSEPIYCRAQLRGPFGFTSKHGHFFSAFRILSFSLVNCLLSL
ncbi:unnamed protein product [Trifolium pratense]|uniref:Uncharacterized protein n=1 Tax=Trifolium pratense TaxID=57577 RepID=A0ACB0K321_TRIPR|nr:unnamed protein product [Trifolium pratense]